MSTDHVLDGRYELHDVGHEHGSRTDEPGVPFIVMECVIGQSLRARLHDGALTLEESIRLQVGVLSALEFSHRAGVVHRDIKPANVMVTLDGGIKVVDFGIARVGGDLVTATQTHALLGPPRYLDPEQVRGEVADARSDLYSAGCLLYNLDENLETRILPTGSCPSTARPATSLRRCRVPTTWRSRAPPRTALDASRRRQRRTFLGSLGVGSATT